MNGFDLKDYPHRRYNPLKGEWVLTSPHRSRRPWQGQVEAAAREQRPSYDPSCYLCPGNERAGGARNPAYTSTFVFDNDFAALLPGAPPAAAGPEAADAGGGLLRAAPERGLCRVVCFSPDHSLTLARMDDGALRGVVDTWAAEYAELGAKDYVNAVQIFENRGEMMGASNPHPHGQVWATSSLPDEWVRETRAQRDYAEARGSCLLCDYLAVESAEGTRVVVEEEAFAAVVPFWAVWPFETLVVSRRHLTGMDELTEGERDSLARTLKRVTTRYDNLFETPFPYTMGFHQRPSDGGDHAGVHFHAHFYPPLLRSATVRKFMVGFELLGGPQRDITPEAAAGLLRALPEGHYLGG